MTEIINVRDSLIKEINDLTNNSQESSERKIDELEQALIKLRQTSIRTVELIVLWRD